MSAVRLFGAEHLGHGAVSHAALPTPLHIGDRRLRLFVSARDAGGESRPYAVDISLDSLRPVGEVHGPLLDLGRTGCFDENGIMPSSVVRLPDDSVRMYYIGWNRGSESVPYRLAIGAARSHDGLTFEREFTGPLLDRSLDDPIFVTAPTVTMSDDDGRASWSMTYVSTSSWDDVQGAAEPRYHLARAESTDGVRWVPAGPEPVELAAEAYGRPSSLKHLGVELLACCHRGMMNYRRAGPTAYKIAMLRRSDTGAWTTVADEITPEGDDAWASEMRCYPQLVADRDRVLMIYNGDGFGRSGALASWLDLDALGVWS